MTKNDETPILTLPGWDKYAKTRKLLERIFEVESRRKVRKRVKRGKRSRAGVVGK